MALNSAVRQTGCLIQSFTCLQKTCDLSCDLIMLFQPFHSHNYISDSPYCLPYNSCSVSSENLILDQVIIP